MLTAFPQQLGRDGDASPPRADGIDERQSVRPRVRRASALELCDGGAGDLLEIEPAAGGATVMVLFNATTVPKIDIAGRRIVVEPPVEA